jgi:hypothetical protein
MPPKPLFSKTTGAKARTAAKKKANAKAKVAPPLTSIHDLVLRGYLYRDYDARERRELIKSLFDGTRLDGYCPTCKQHTTYTARCTQDRLSWADFAESAGTGLLFVTLTCLRDDKHSMVSFFLAKQWIIKKIGQYPSVADMTADETHMAKQILRGDDRTEYNTAVGLAASGVGIGSFIYLRRIFERLIQNKFQQHRSTLDSPDEEFSRMRMAEKITCLKDHLPDFLLEQRRLYAILSSGVHEWSDAECMQMFPVIKSTILNIIIDDAERTERAKRKAELQIELAKITTSRPQTQ